MAEFPFLTLYTFAPVLGMLVIFCIPSKRGDIIKTVAAAAAAVPLIVATYIFFAFRDDGGMHYYENRLWIGGLGVFYKLGIDGISAPMIILSGLVGFVAVVASWGIEKQVKGYFALILLLLTGMNGVFCALDFFLFYVFWELMLLPMYFLIGVWGGPARVYAAIKFFLYTMAGSVLMLVVLLATWYWSDGGFTHDQQTLLRTKEAVLKAHGPLLADVAAQEKARKALGTLAPLGELELAGLFDKHRVDRPDARNLAAGGLTAYVAKLRAVDGPQGEARDAAINRISLARTFDFPQLGVRYRFFTGSFGLFGASVGFATLMFVLLYVAFAIKVPVFPFHTWLPWAHVEAPTAISVILAGILLKMGVYGFFRVAYPIFPTAAVDFAVPIAIFGVFSIIYGACCSLAQTDLKKIVAYSSVSHMGYCMLGLSALTLWGMTGSVLQMFNHGTSTSMLFLLVGVIYDRAHHRDVNGFGGLATQLPVYAGIFAVAVFASMGLPGLSGFISEILVFLGAFRSDMGSHSMISLSFQSMTIIAAGGVILAAAYLLWMLQRVFFGPLNEKYKGYADLSGRELLSLVPLVIVIVIFGVYPQPLIDLTYTSVNRTMQHVRNADMARRPAATTVLAATPKAGGAADAVKTGEAAEDTARIESAPEPRPQTVSAAQPAQLPRATAAASPATATP